MPSDTMPNYSLVKDHLSPTLQWIVKFCRSCLPLLDWFELNKVNQCHADYSACLEKWLSEDIKQKDVAAEFLQKVSNYLERLSNDLVSSAGHLRQQANGQTRYANAELREKLASQLCETKAIIQDPSRSQSDKLRHAIQCLQSFDAILASYRDSGQLSARYLPLPFHFPNAILFNSFYHENAALLQCANCLFSAHMQPSAHNSYLNIADKMVLAALTLSPFRFASDPVHDIDLRRFRQKLADLIKEAEEQSQSRSPSQECSYYPKTNTLLTIFQKAKKDLDALETMEDEPAIARKVVTFHCHQLSGAFAAERFRKERLKPN